MTEKPQLTHYKTPMEFISAWRKYSLGQEVPQPTFPPVMEYDREMHAPLRFESPTRFRHFYENEFLPNLEKEFIESVEYAGGGFIHREGIEEIVEIPLDKRMFVEARFTSRVKDLLNNSATAPDINEEIRALIDDVCECPVLDPYPFRIPIREVSFDDRHVRVFDDKCQLFNLTSRVAGRPTMPLVSIRTVVEVPPLPDGAAFFEIAHERCSDCADCYFIELARVNLPLYLQRLTLAMDSDSEIDTQTPGWVTPDTWVARGLAVQILDRIYGETYWPGELGSELGALYKT